MSNEVGDVHGQVVQAGHVGRIDVHPAPILVTALSGLPPATAVFCGRHTELAALRACWSAEGPAVVSSSVAGLAGIGKTELVLHAAHRAVDDGEFPGGVLFVDLQGYDEARRVSSAQALDGFLRALGVDSHQIPPTEDQRAVLYRSVLHSRPRMLVVLDNTASTAQVRPLLPGSRHAVVITSRHTLSGLDEAHHLDLGLLAESEAVDLVGHPGLATLCGRLPLALRIMRALITTDPHADWEQELADAQHRLDLLDDGDSRGVHAAFDLSYRALDAEQARLFRLLALHPTDEFPVEGSAALVDRPLPRVRQLLRELVRAHLVEPGTSPGWYTFHDLVRLYASCHAKVDDESTAALSRMLRHYATRTFAAQSFLSPRLIPDDEHFDSRKSAFDWLHRGWRVLDAALRLAAEQHDHDALFTLMGGLCSYFDVYRHTDELHAIYVLALDAARSTGDRLREAAMTAELGNAHARIRQYDDALALLDSSLSLHRALGDAFGLAKTLNDIGTVHRKTARLSEASARYHEALDLWQSIGDRYGMAQTLNNLGNTARDLGDHTGASERYEQSLAIRQEIGDRLGEAQVLNNLGANLALAGHSAAALLHHRSALRMYRELGQQFREAGTLFLMGRTQHAAGTPESARSSWQAALAIYERLGAEREAQEVRDLLAHP
ncbi:tetratricopeptide repeat protein [Lentzea sp. JNUCC 0626]|uniref:tetratricopeptide repeat protein n=1 Tax=Lentzea sp. JNUCC 0626 TaxID=3367513 RepID=UPI00374A4DAB